jgi:hypothetical protein
MRLFALVLLPGLVFVLGCAAEPAGAPHAKKVLVTDSSRAEAQEPAAAREAAPALVLGGGGGVAPAPAPAGKQEPRKLNYSGQLELVVDTFDLAVERFLALLKEHDGYVARSEVHGEPGAPRNGKWTVRVPAGKFDSFLDEASHLGEMRRSTVDSEDVTDRYHDTRAEVKNLEFREEALRALYKEKIAGSKLTDLLDVDRELNTVRGQINVRKGQLQRWDKETEYASLVVTIQDRKGYVPPLSPDFGTSIGRTFHGSIEALLTVGRGIVLVAVALTPWLGVLLVVALPTWLVWRLTRRFTPLATALPVPPEGSGSGVTLPRDG